MERWRGQALRVLAGSGRDCGADRERGRRQGQAEGGDHPQQGRDPDDPRRRLQGPRVRLRLRVRRGQHLHDRRVLRDVRRRALDATSAPTPDSPDGYTNLAERPLLRADQGHRDHRQGARRAAAGRPEEEGHPGGQGLRRRLQPLPRQDRGRRTSPTRPAPARRGSATSPPPTSGGASTSSASSPRAGGRGRDRRRRAAAAARRGAGADAARRRATSPRSARRSTRPAPTPARTAGASAATATENGSGMVLGNPHFPWQGSERFYQSHLVVPGKVNVSGASLFGVPVINIGHTAHLAWTHTVSTAFRFVPIQLTLVPGDPTSYLVDGQPEKMTPRRSPCRSSSPTARSRRSRGRSTRPATARCITSLQGQSLFDWTTDDGLRDVRRQRRQPALRQPLPRRQPRPVDQRAARRAQEVRGHPVGEHDGRRTRAARRSTPTSARSRTSPTRRRPGPARRRSGR